MDAELLGELVDRCAGCSRFEECVDLLAAEPGLSLTRTARSLPGQSVDFFNARQIINGHDRAELIAGHAKKFQQVLDRAGGT